MTTPTNCVDATTDKSKDLFFVRAGKASAGVTMADQPLEVLPLKHLVLLGVRVELATHGSRGPATCALERALMGTALM